MDTWVWIVIAVVVVLAVVALLAAAANKKKVERRRVEAEQIRTDAHAQSAGVIDAERQAREAEQNAARARAEAERAEQQAAEAARARDMEHATHEDRIREADRIDPDVDTRSPDYVPGTQPGTAEPVREQGSGRVAEPGQRFDTRTGETLDGADHADHADRNGETAATGTGTHAGTHAGTPTGSHAGTPEGAGPARHVDQPDGQTTNGTAPNTEPYGTPPPPAR